MLNQKKTNINNNPKKDRYRVFVNVLRAPNIPEKQLS